MFNFFQGDELPDVFRLFRDVHVNFTIFSMMPYDTADKTIRNYDNGFNLTLAKDSMSLLEKVTKTTNLNRSVEDVRRSLQTAIKQVRHFSHKISDGLCSVIYHIASCKYII